MVNLEGDYEYWEDDSISDNGEHDDWEWEKD